MATENPRFSVTLDPETHKQLVFLAQKSGKSKSELSRIWIEQGLNGKLNVDNIDMITEIIRTQLQDVLNLSTERLAALSAKTCIQAGTAAYLSAEAIMKFVPEKKQMEVETAYEMARKKAVAYMRKNADLTD